MTSKNITEYLLSLADKDIAKHSQTFFKTAKGEYGYGDIFLGIRVPIIRKAVKKFKDAPLNVIEKLLSSKYHEIRLFALLCLVLHFSDTSKQEKIYHIYLNNTKFINNWDLIDSSAHYIVGNYLQNRDKAKLYKLSTSTSLWERRIAIISTFYFIKQNNFYDTLKIAKQLLDDKEDLIHKAVGWMLREIGKRSMDVEVEFLNKHYKTMPRTMLRYAIEKFEESTRQKYLKGEI